MNPSLVSQNAEEGIRQQALNRAQRVRRHAHDDVTQHTEMSSTSSGDGGPSQSRSDDMAPMDTGTSGECHSGATKPHDTSTEVELIFRPRLSSSEIVFGDEHIRFIKTTSNATGKSTVYK